MKVNKVFNVKVGFLMEFNILCMCVVVIFVMYIQGKRNVMSDIWMIFRYCVNVFLVSFVVLLSEMMLRFVKIVSKLVRIFN